jgi:hypothetical protein
MQNAIQSRAVAFLGTAALAVYTLASSTTVVAQGKAIYTDPGGAYSVRVPNGWEAQPQQGSPMVSILNARTKVSVTLGAMKGPAGQTPDAQSQLKNLEGQIQAGCKQEKVEQRGATEIAGLRGVFVAVHCNGADGPEYMRLTAATGPGAVALVITASPGDAYLKELIPLEEIRSSFRLTAAPGAAAAAGRMGANGGAMDGRGSGAGGGVSGGPLANGSSQTGMSAAGGGFGSPQGGGNGTYHDPQGRFSLSVPAGWNSASDNGNLTLSSGPAWVSVATGTGGQPGDENHQIVQQIQAQYKDFKILNEGDFQNNGHASHGTNATGINPKGQRVSMLVVSISAGSGNYLILISSSPNEQAQQANSTAMQIAQSVRFAGE